MTRRYEPAEVFQLRIPALPVSAYASPRRSLAESMSDPVFRAAIGIASADLGRGLDAYRGGDPATARERRLCGSIFRYRSRAATRPTPFGLFAGVAFGEVAEKAEISVGTPAIRQARIRPDVRWLSALAADLEKRPEIRRRLKVMVDPCLYADNGYLWLGDQRTENDGQRLALRVSAPLRMVLEIAAEPVAFTTLAETVGARFPNVSADRVERLLAELIGRSVLITDLVPDLSVQDPLCAMADRITETASPDPVAEEMRQVSERFHTAGANIREMPARLEGLTTRQRVVTPSFNEPTFQCDALADVADPALTREIAVAVADAAGVLCGIGSMVSGSTVWSRYHKAFDQRYGGAAKVPLLELLDPYTGLGAVPGYKHPRRRNPLPIGPAEDRAAIDHRFACWAMEAAMVGCTELELTDERLREIVPEPVPPEQWPLTLEAFFGVAARSIEAVNAGEWRAVLMPMGFGRAGRAMGRFADQLSERQRRALRDLYRHEESRFPDAIFAEVWYQPSESRYGNIAMSPPMRDFQIPVNVPATAAGGEVIPLSDLAVGIRDEGFSVFSVSRGVEVIATQSHMLSPVQAPNAARFLLEVSAQRCGQLPGLGFLDDLPLPYFPRLVRGRTVLRPAQWRLSAEQVARLLDGPQEGFFDAVQEWRAHYRVPRHVYAARFDKRLLIDLDDPDTVMELRRELRTLRRRTGGTSGLTMQEASPGLDEMWVADRDGRRYAAEFVLPLSLGRPRSDAVTSGESVARPESAGHAPTLPVLSHRARIVPAGTEWTYLKLYLAEELLDSAVTAARALTDELGEQGLIDRWFFIRYGDPQLHLRLRLRAMDPARTGEVLDHSVRWGRRLIAEGLIRDQEVCTYVRELERYGGPEAIGPLEALFHADSVLTTDLLSAREEFPLDMTGVCAVSLNELFRRWGMTERTRSGFARDRASGRPGGRVFTGEDRTLIRELLTPSQDGPVSTRATELRDRLAAIFDPHTGQIEAVSTTLSELEKGGRLYLSKETVARSVAHMHVNRMAGLSRVEEKKVNAKWHYGLKAVQGRRTSRADRNTGEVER